MFKLSKKCHLGKKNARPLIGKDLIWMRAHATLSSNDSIGTNAPSYHQELNKVLKSLNGPSPP